MKTLAASAAVLGIWLSVLGQPAGMGAIDPLVAVTTWSHGESGAMSVLLPPPPADLVM